MRIPQPLLDSIAARADEIEVARRLPADLAADMAAAGLFRIATPRTLGGAALAPAEIVRVFETVAAADAATGWCLMIGTASAMMLARLPEASAARVFADPHAITGGAVAPFGRATPHESGDGWRVSGKWPWASGSANCHWLTGGSVIADPARPDAPKQFRVMVFPRTACTLLDTWHAAGLKGTGSGDFQVENVHVPAAMSFALDDPLPGGGPLAAIPVFGMLALGIAGVAAGNARAALDTLTVGLGSRRPQGSSRSAAERATVQADIARAEAALTAARALMSQSIARAETESSAGPVGLETRARLRLAATHMVRTAADVTRTAYDLGGGSALYLESPLQRRFRDAHAMTQHMMVQPATWELAGRVLLGLETDASVL